METTLLERKASAIGKIPQSDPDNWAEHEYMVIRAREWLEEIRQVIRETFELAYDRWGLLESMIDGDAPRRFYVGDADDVDSQLSYRIVRTLVGRLRRDFFGGEEWLRMVPLSHEDHEYAEEATSTITTVVKDADMEREGSEALENAIGLGFGTLYRRYQQRRTSAVDRIVRHPLERKEDTPNVWVRKRSVGSGQRKTVETDHLVCEAMSNFDVTFPSDARDPVNGEFVGLTFYWDEDEVQQKWDTEQWCNELLVKRVDDEEGDVPFLRDTGTSGYLGRRGVDGVSERMDRYDRYGNYLRPWEYRGGIGKCTVELYFAKFTLLENGGRPQECVLYFVNGEPVYIKPNKLNGEYRPVAIGRYERIPRLALGRSAIEPSASFHLYVNGLLQQGMDSLLWENNPMVAYKEDAEFEPQEINPHPGLWIAMADPQSDVKPITFNTNAGPVAMQHYARIAEEGFSISGANEVLRGEMGSKMSATQYKGTEQAAASRIWEPTANLEEELIVASYIIAQKLIMQFFREEMLIKIGSEAALQHIWVFPDEAVTGFRIRGIGAVELAQAREAAREMLSQMSVFTSAVQAGIVQDVDMREGWRLLFKMSGMPKTVIDAMIPQKNSIGAMTPNSEHRCWIAGSVPGVHPREDHETHMEGHIAFMNSKDWDRLNPDIQTRAAIHIEQTEQAYAAQVQEDMNREREMMGMMMAGGGGGNTGMGTSGGMPGPADLQQMAAAGQRSGSQAAQAMPGQVDAARQMAPGGQGG